MRRGLSTTAAPIAQAGAPALHGARSRRANAMGKTNASGSDGEATADASQTPSGQRWFNIIQTLSSSSPPDPQHKPLGPHSDLNVVSTIRAAINAAHRDAAWAGNHAPSCRLALVLTCPAPTKPAGFCRLSTFQIMFSLCHTFVCCREHGVTRLASHGVAHRLWSGGAPAERARHRVPGRLRRC